jgi:aminobenzoyl-glutamate utilization protein B
MTALSWHRLDEHWLHTEPAARQVAARLWDHPELGLDEHHAAALLTGWLAREGFDVTTGVAGLPTAFTAALGGPGASVGLLAEYDALPGLSNEARPSRAPVVANGPGHGCGHNLIAAANIAAAIAASRYLRELGHPGRVVVFGAPAEEILVGKLAMLKAGVFDQADVLLTSHADYQNAALSRPCMAVASAEFIFTGQQGHTGWVVRGNALDAAESFLAMCERVRPHLIPGVPVEHVLRSPHPVVPNVAPEQVGVWCYLRHADVKRVLGGYGELARLAQLAGQAAGVRVSPVLIAATRGYLPNDELARHLGAALRQVGPPQWTGQDLGELASFAQALGAPPEIRAGLESGILTTGTDPYGQDDGEVSWSKPLGRVNWAIPTGVPLHSWAAAALFGTPAAWKGAAMASRALAVTTVSLLCSPDAVSRAQAEHEARVAAAGPAPEQAGALAPVNAGIWGGLLPSER